MNIVLIVAAHGDDEVLGCGGTIARHVASGDEVHLVVMADGVTSRGSDDGQEARNDAIAKSTETLGIQSVSRLGLPDNKMDSLSLLEIIQPLEKVIENLKPNIIYTHHSGDLNVDHVVTNRAVLTACRPQPGFCVQKIYAFEVLSSTEWAEQTAANAFLPNHYVDISAYFDTKMEALKCYNMEMREVWKLKTTPTRLESVPHRTITTASC